jgi:hypothetical protein
MQTRCYRQSYQEDAIRAVRERLFFYQYVSYNCTLRYDTVRSSLGRRALYPPTLPISGWVMTHLGKGISYRTSWMPNIVSLPL